MPIIRPGKLRLVLAVGLSLGIGACAKENTRVCSTPMDIRSEATPKERATGCIHRWAYRLARNKDNPDMIADAIVGGCRPDIDVDIIETRLAQRKANHDDKTAKGPYYAGQRAVSADGRAVLKYDPDRGWETDTDADNEKRLATYHALAMFHVMQARAGQCTVP
jgi:hypothetical protein